MRIVVEDRAIIGKKMHATRAVATREAKRMHKRYKMKFEAYACGFCGAFHFGGLRSKEAGKRRKNFRLTNA